ncbi:MAG: HEAT repeat domain-containing protein [Anaerolineae bacterium]|nr:HEAT repeat domain-containing protein [Anaerolineae bacterium]
MEDIEFLVKQVLDTENYTIHENTEALIKLTKHNDPRIAELLIQALSNTDPKVRVKAIWALREIPDARAINPLIACLEDSNPKVRGCAVSVLASLRIEAAIEPILRKLADTEREVRFSTLWALNTFQIKDARAVEPLIQVLEDTDDKIGGTTYQAIDALVAISDLRAVEPLISVVNREKIFENLPVRRKAVQGLGELQDARAVPILIKTLSDWSGEGQRVFGFEEVGGWPSMCDYAAHALEKIGTKEALEAVQQWRSTPYPNGGLRLS